MIEFDYAFATDAPGDPKISMMVATDSIHGSLFAVVARRKGGQDDFVMWSFQNYVDRLGLVKAELKCDQAPSTLDVANAKIKRCQSTALIVTATPKNSKGSLRRGERANWTIQGQLRAFREAVSMKYKTEVGPDHVLMCWMVRHCALDVSNFPSEGHRKTLIVLSGERATLEKLCHLAECAWGGIFGRGWGQIEHEVDARSFCRQA